MQARPSDGAADKKWPGRVVSLAPHITEIVFKLNKGDVLIARTDFCTFPSAAKKLPSVGGYLNLNMEYLVALQPDLILDFPNSRYRAKLEELGFSVVENPNETIEEILASILKVGRTLGAEARAEMVVRGIQDTLKMVEKVLPEGKRPAAILVVGRQPGSLEGLTVAGPQTYLSEIWEICGGKNAFPAAPARYFTPAAEALFHSTVDAILEFFPDGPVTRPEAQKVWKDYSHLKAVKKKAIWEFHDSAFLIPGPRVSKVALTFQQIVEDCLKKYPGAGK